MFQTRVISLLMFLLLFHICISLYGGKNTKHHKRGSRHAATALRWRVDQLLKYRIKRLTLSSRNGILYALESNIKMLITYFWNIFTP